MDFGGIVLFMAGLILFTMVCFPIDRPVKLFGELHTHQSGRLELTLRTIGPLLGRKSVSLGICARHCYAGYWNRNSDSIRSLWYVCKIAERDVDGLTML